MRTAECLLLVLLLGLDGRHGDTVQVTLSTLGDAATSLVLVLLQNTNLLQRLHDLPVDRSGGVDVVRWARTTVLDGAVDLSQTTDTDGLAHVNVTSDGGGTDVVPVFVSNQSSVRVGKLFFLGCFCKSNSPVDALRGQLVGVGGLDGINPSCR